MAPVVHERRSRRRLVRMQTPLKVEIEGRQFQASDWSLGGFSIMDGEGAWSAGDRRRAVLTFPVDGLSVAFEVGCQVARVGLEGRIGFHFCDIRPDQQSFLREVMDALVTGRAMAAEGVLLARGGQEWSAEAGPVAQDARPSAGASAVRLAGYALLLAAGVALLAVAGLSLYGRVLTVRSAYAAVTARMITVAAPHDGFLSASLASPGREVAEGSLLGQLQDARLDREITVAEAALARQDAVIASLRRRHQAAVAFMAVYEGLADAAVAQADAGLAGGAAELEAATRHADRTRRLHSDGFATEAALEAAIRRKAAAESAVRQSAAGLSAANVNRRIVAEGRLFTGSRIEGREPGEIAEDLAVAEAERVFLERQHAALVGQRAALALASPCACLVHAVLRQPGEWVAAGTSLLQLVSSGERDMVLAKIPLHEAALLRTGGPAEVLAANRDAPLAGRIQEIDLMPPAAPRTGLPESIDRNPEFASVYVRLDHRLSEGVGVPAQVLLPIGLGSAFFHWWGLAADSDASIRR